MKAGLRLIGPHRGVLLVQLPPEFECDFSRLDYFLQQLSPWLKTLVELRHPSWHREGVFAFLAERSVAY